MCSAISYPPPLPLLPQFLIRCPTDYCTALHCSALHYTAIFVDTESCSSLLILVHHPVMYSVEILVQITLKHHFTTQKPNDPLNCFTVNLTAGYPVKYGAIISTFPTVLTSSQGAFVFSAPANPGVETIQYTAVCGNKNESGDFTILFFTSPSFGPLIWTLLLIYLPV